MHMCVKTVAHPSLAIKAMICSIYTSKFLLNGYVSLTSHSTPVATTSPSTLEGIMQGRNRKIFQKGQSHLSWFFSQREILFPDGKFPFWLTHKKKKKKKSVVLKSQKKKKKKKKKVLSSFSHFLTPPLPFSIFHLPFLIFLLFCSIFPFFLASFFPVGQQKFPGQKSRGMGALPSTCYATGTMRELCSPSICSSFSQVLSLLLQ